MIFFIILIGIVVLLTAFISYINIKEEKDHKAELKSKGKVVCIYCKHSGGTYFLYGNEYLNHRDCLHPNLDVITHQFDPYTGFKSETVHPHKLDQNTEGTCPLYEEVVRSLPSKIWRSL